ncbi:MAG: SDR family oxidoreductase [Pirellulaceae bacterium]|nr:SDR family oxidoreductase [Pirellulaceae bacterium]
MKRILVTGGAGFIGSHIAQALVRRGDQVRVLDSLCSGFKHNLAEVAEDIEFIEGDVADETAVARAVAGVELVYHQAALASVPMSIEKPMATNQACVTGTLNVLNQSVKAGVKRVVYAASSSAYGDRPYSAKRETDLPQVLSPYAAAKLAGELYLQAFYHSFGLETVGLRYFNVFGPRQDPASPYSAVIPLFVTRLLSGQPPIVYGDGGQSRDFTFVGNVVPGNRLAGTAEGVAGQIMNLADGRRTSLLQLLELLAKLLGVSVQPDFRPPRVGDVRESLADISMARNLLNYEPSTTLEDGLAQTIDYYRSLAN